MWNTFKSTTSIKYHLTPILNKLKRLRVSILLFTQFIMICSSVHQVIDQSSFENYTQFFFPLCPLMLSFWFMARISERGKNAVCVISFRVNSQGCALWKSICLLAPSQRTLVLFDELFALFLMHVFDPLCISIIPCLVRDWVWNYNSGYYQICLFVLMCKWKRNSGLCKMEWNMHLCE